MPGVQRVRKDGLILYPISCIYQLSIVCEISESWISDLVKIDIMHKFMSEPPFPTTTISCL